MYQNYEVTEYSDLKAMLRGSAELFGERRCLSQIDGASVSFCELEARVNALGTALVTAGLCGRKIILCGENGIAWAVSYLAVVCGVGVIVPVDKGISNENLLALARRLDAGAVIGSGRDKALRGHAPYIDFHSLDGWIGRGKRLLSLGEQRYTHAAVDPNALAVLHFSLHDGKLGHGVMLSHRNLCANLAEMCRMVKITERDIFLSVLPLHHSYECTCGFLCPLYRGAAVVFGGGMQSLLSDMRKASPTVMLCIPAIAETLLDRAWAKIRRRDSVSYARATIRATDALSPTARMATKRRVFSDLHADMGGALRLLICGGDKVSPSVLSGWRELGVLALAGYGHTECAPVLALNRDSFYRDEAAGLTMPNTFIDICNAREDGVGEIRFRGESIMLGYYEEPELTARTLRDGWFYTGELGYTDPDGFLYVIGRRQNVILKPDGTRVIPEELESRLCESVYIKEALVTMDACGKIVARLFPDYTRVPSEETKHPNEWIRTEVWRAVAEVNGGVPRERGIDRFEIVSDPLPKTPGGRMMRGHSEK